MLSLVSNSRIYPKEMLGELSNTVWVVPQFTAKKLRKHPVFVIFEENNPESK